MTSHTQASVYSHFMARRGEDNITVRMAHDLWERFGDVVDNRSTVLREFVRWYVREPGARMPRREPMHRGPWEPIDRTDEGDQGDRSSRSTP